MSQDLPEPLQELYETVVQYLEVEEAQDALEALVAPYRAAQGYVAGTYPSPCVWRTAWNIDPASKHPGTATQGGRIIDNPPTLMDLVLKAQQQEDV